MLPMAFVRVRYYLQGSKTGFCKIKKRACAETDDCLVIRTCPTKNIIHSCKFSVLKEPGRCVYDSMINTGGCSGFTEVHG